MPPALSRRRLLAVYALVGACLLGAGFFTLRRSGASSPPPTPQDAPAATTLVQASDRAYRPGTVYRYALTTEQSVKVTAKKPGADVPPSMHFEMKGEWRVGVCEERVEGIDARITFVPTEVFVNVDDTPLAPEAEKPLRRDSRACSPNPSPALQRRARKTRRIKTEKSSPVAPSPISRSSSASCPKKQRPAARPSTRRLQGSSRSFV